MPIKILLVDDHAVVRAGVRTVLSRNPEMEIVGEASNGKDALQAAKDLHPDVVLMDVSMPVMDGVEATGHLRAEFPDIRVVALTMRTDKVCMDSMLMAGAVGFLPKDCSEDDLIQAVHCVMKGDFYLNPGLARLFVSGYMGMAQEVRKLKQEDLTPGEVDVLKLLADGKSTKESATLLSLSTKTIEDRRQKVMAKLGVSNVAELVKYAIRNGLTTLEP